MVNKKRLTEEFCRLTAIDSVTYREREMADHLKRVFSSMNIELKEDNTGRIYNGNAGNLYGYIEGKGMPVLLSAHMDTVEPGIGKRAVVHNDGRITSSGNTVLGADDAAGLAAITEAVRAVKENNIIHRPIEILLSAAEEVYAKGTRAFDFSSIRSKEAYVLDLSGDIGTAVTEAPSIIFFKVNIRGRAAHAGFSPDMGINSIAAASKAIAQIRQGGIDSLTALNIGTIKGGMATNIVPENCIVEGEIRSLDHNKAMELLNNVKAVFEKCCNEINAVFTFEHNVGIKAYKISKNSSTVINYENACAQLGIRANFISTFGGSDNNNLVERGIEGIVISCGMNNVHSCQEYTSVDDLVKSTEILINIITSVDEKRA